MLSQSFGSVPQDTSDCGIVWHDECGQQLRHVGNSTPLVPRQQPDREVLFIQHCIAIRQT
ncbi:hypothetical protein M527_15700 [Sphingobium indicum IP26]|nr:hypothetical protein M527_15700 [Sphingobium indicum IP26]